MFLLVLFALAATILAQQASVTPVVNPGFEDCTTGIPNGWIQGGSSNSSMPTAVCSQTYKHSGNNSALFLPFSINKAGNQSTYISQLSQSVAFLEAGQPITLSYWVFFAGVPQGADSSSSGRYNFTVTYNNNAESSINIFPQVVPGTGNRENNFFYQFTTTFNAPSNGRRGGNLTITFMSDRPSIMIYLDDVSLTAPTIVGDPQFVGLRGQSYQVHGIDGEYYNIITDTNQQMNSKFVFLNSGRCPIIKQSKKQSNKNCWSHPGSYLGEIGIQQYVDDQLIQLQLIAGDYKQGFASVRIDGEPLSIGSQFNRTVKSDQFLVSYLSTHQVQVTINQFDFMFDNSDMFINQAVRPLVSLNELTCHGLFGQTHVGKRYSNSLKHIVGRVDDYMLEDHHIWGTNFMYNKFQ